ncbi:Rad52/Rad22 family DNA repair protein [Rhodococcus sp. SJ-2]
MSFTADQIEQLLQPIRNERVLADGKGNAHVSQQDITAHLTRVFGFGNWDTDLLTCDLVFEEPSLDKRTSKPSTSRYDVCYRATVRLTVKDPDGNEVCHYEDGSTGTAQNQKRGDAHDLAMKSAISLSLKRCAKSLGDQFGLSLYNKGQRTALVKGTLVRPGVEAPKDVQDGVEQQVSLGTDETAHDHGLRHEEDDPEPPPVEVDLDSLFAAVEQAPDKATLQNLWRESAAVADKARKSEVRELIKARSQDLEQPEQQTLGV